MIMKGQIIKRFSSRLAVWLAAVVILTAASHTVWAQQGQQDDFPALPQSTDANHPTPITSRSFSGELRGSSQDYFYSLTAGPGQASLTLVVVVAEGSAAQAVVDVYDQNGSPLLSNLAVRGTTNGEPVSQSFMVAAPQNVFLRVRDTSGNQGIFGVQLDGAVEVGQVGQGQGVPAQTGGYPAQGNGYPAQGTAIRPYDRPGNVRLKFQTKKHGTFTVTFNVGDRRSPNAPPRQP
jgi:hypothetical protein